MVPPGHILLLLFLPVAAAQTSAAHRSGSLHAISSSPLPKSEAPEDLQPSLGSCSGCGPLSLPLLASLVAADAFVSLLIVGVVFACARPRHRPTQEDGKIYMNMPGRG